MSTTARNTTTPTTEELQALSEEMNAWMDATGRKLFPRAKQDELAALGVKRCGRCTEVRPISEYGKNASTADGLQGRCRACQIGYNAEWREANPEYDRAYHAANREKRNETSRRWRAEHPEETRAYAREYQRTMYATDEIHRLRDQLKRGYHRAVEAGNPAEWVTAEDLLTFWSEKGIDPLVCILTGEQLTPQTRGIDHATPISRGGSHRAVNLIPVSFDANRAKGSRTLLEYMADRAAAQDPEELPELVRKAMETSVPARAKRTLLVQIEEKEGTDA